MNMLHASELSLRRAIVPTYAGAVAILIACVGCDSSPVRQVHGTVTLEGKPLETGEIAFRVASGSSGPTAGATIENGDYAVPAVEQGLRVGNTYRVEISSWVGQGRMAPDPNDPSGQRELLENIIPERYGANSEITIVISADRSQNRFDFDLEED